MGVTLSEKGTAQAVPFEVLELPLREFPTIAEPKATAESQELAAGNKHFYVHNAVGVMKKCLISGG